MVIRRLKPAEAAPVRHVPAPMLSFLITITGASLLMIAMFATVMLKG